MTEKVNENEKIAVLYFIEHPTAYISEISEQTGISKSSIQRYLKKNGELFTVDGKTISEQLLDNMRRGQHKGGIQSFKNNDFIKDDKGHFIGNAPTKTEEDKELKKREDIKRICTYYLSNKNLTLDDLAATFFELFGYTRDYVYDCLLDPRVLTIMGEDKAKEIEKTLEYNQNSFLRKLMEANIDVNNISAFSELTELEKNIFMIRFNNFSTSLDEIALELNLSRATILKYENRAIAKIADAIGKIK